MLFHRILIILIVLLPCSSFSQIDSDGIVTLSWVAPTTFEDGSDASAITLSYKLYYGNTSHKNVISPIGGVSASPYDNVISLANPTNLEYITNILSGGIWYFRLTASYVDSGGSVIESKFSNEALVLVGAFPNAENVNCLYDATVVASSPTIIGITPIVWSSGANPSPQSIVIPPETTGVYLFWGFWANGAYQLNTATLGGNTYNQISQSASGSSANAALGVAAWYQSTQGSQTLDISWTGGPSDGPTSIVLFVKDGNISSWRDVGIDNGNGVETETISVSVNSNDSDLILKYDYRFGEGVLPGVSIGWTSHQTQSNNGADVRLSSADLPGSTSTTCDSENERWSGVICISIPPLN